MKSNKILSCVFIGIALVFNEWSLARVLSPDGRIETTVHRITIYHLQALFLIVGFLILIVPGRLKLWSPVQRRAFFRRLLVAIGLASLGGVFLAHQSYIHLNAGLRINKVAWIATYTDRGLIPPPEGPRSGYWVSRMQSVPHPDLGWVYRPIQIPGVLEVDENGFQYVGFADGWDQHLLIVGGSVAFGIYASEQAKTYFSVLANRLEIRGHRPRLSILTTGAWCSRHELAALRLRGLSKKPDALLLLDGLNDLVFEKAFPPEGRVQFYLDNVCKIRDIARDAGLKVILVLQPSITEKTTLTKTESRLLELMTTAENSLSVLNACIPGMRAGLARLAAEDPGTWFIDLSGLFADEKLSTFTDLWHLSDMGHARLGERLAHEVEPILFPDSVGPVQGQGDRELEPSTR